MLTDAPPRKSDLHAFRESDRITTLDIPDDALLPHFANAIESAMKAQQTAFVRSACAQFLKVASQLYAVPMHCSGAGFQAAASPRALDNGVIWRLCA